MAEAVKENGESIYKMTFIKGMKYHFYKGRVSVVQSE